MRTVLWTAVLAIGLVQCSEEAEKTAASSTSFEGLALTCGGTEPFWSLKVEGDQALYHPMVGDDETWTLTSREKAAGRTDYEILLGVDSQGGSLSLAIQKTGQCSDGMSDFVYDKEILVTREGGEALAGCCDRLN